MFFAFKSLQATWKFLSKTVEKKEGSNFSNNSTTVLKKSAGPDKNGYRVVTN
jgi:hypothetical protein